MGSPCLMPLVGVKEQALFTINDRCVMDIFKAREKEISEVSQQVVKV